MDSLIAQLIDTEDASMTACGCAWSDLLDAGLRAAVRVLSSRPTPEQAIDAIVELRCVLRGHADAKSRARA